MEIRYYGDKISERIAKTPEGFLICQDVPISRTGYQEYLASELMDNPINKHKIIPVYRPAKEVFDPRSLASFEGKPVTNEHPDEDVTPENYQRYSCGHVQNVHVGDGEDSNKVLADLYITDPTLIRLIEDGKREISCGYYAEEHRDDTGKLCQVKIRGNHVAVVRNGRAGKTVCIRDKHPYKGKKGFNRFKEGNLMSNFRNEHLIEDDLFDDDCEILDDAYEYLDEDNFEDDDFLLEDENAYLDTFYKDYGVKGMQKGKHVKASDPDYLEQIRGGGGTKRTTPVAVKKPGMSTGKKAAIAAGVGAAALGGALLARKYGLGKKLGSGLSKAFGKKKSSPLDKIKGAFRKKKASPLDKIKGVFGKKKKPSAFDRFKSAFRKKKSVPPQSDRLLSAKIRAASMKNSANKALNSAKNYGNDKLLSGRIRASSMASSAKNLAKTARYNARNMAESAKRFGSDKLLSAKISLAAKRKGLDSMPYYKKRLHYYDDFDLEDDDPILEDEDFLEDDDVILEDEDEFVDEDYLEDEDEFVDEDELMEDDDDYIENDEEDVVVDDDYLEDEDELVEDEDEFVDEDELMEDEDYLEDEDDLMEDDEDVIVEDEDDLSEQASNVLRDAKSILRDARAHLNRMKKRDAIILNDDDLEETYDDEEELLEDDEDYLEDEDDLMEDDEDVIVDDDLEEGDCLEDDDEIFEEETDVVEDDDDEFVEDEDELMEDDEDIIVEDGCHKDGAIDTDKAQALREITEASRSITDPNERKQLQDAIYKALCGRNQMQDVMRITKRNMKSRMDSAAKKNSKVDLTQQQSIYDSLNPHKKTSF